MELHLNPPLAASTGHRGAAEERASRTELVAGDGTGGDRLEASQLEEAV